MYMYMNHEPLHIPSKDRNEENIFEMEICIIIKTTYNLPIRLSGNVSSSHLELN